jgi:hypothetical protein
MMGGLAARKLDGQRAASIVLASRGHKGRREANASVTSFANIFRLRDC